MISYVSDVVASHAMERHDGAYRSGLVVARTCRLQVKTRRQGLKEAVNGCDTARSRIAPEREHFAAQRRPITQIVGLSTSRDTLIR